MRIRHSKNAAELIEECKYLVKTPSIYKGKYKELFMNDNPIYLEIGMGKGDFILKSALKNPNINYIGVEKYDSVIAKAIIKINNYHVDNLKLMRFDAIGLKEVFDHEIDTILLNFSDPWPKKRHAKRRLTSDVFLEVYDSLFTSKAHIILKTDNTKLFESSVISLNNYGYKFNEIFLDLHHSNKENIMTEYETKFSSMGEHIKYLDCEK